MEKKKIDVLITTYNRNERLKETLSILSNQTEKDFNLIINDDGSEQLINPNDYPIITKYLWNFDFGYHRVRRFNESVRLSISDKILLLDDDCVPQSEDYISTFIDLLDDFDVVQGRLKFSNGIVNGNFFSTANAGFNKNILNKVGGLFDNYFDGSYGYEDWDLEHRIKKDKTIKFMNAINNEKTMSIHGNEYYKDGDRSDEIIGRNKKYLENKWNIKVL